MNNDHFLELARNRARRILADNEYFRRMPVEDQRLTYQRVVEEQLAAVRQEENGKLATGMAQKASDLLDDKRHERSFEEGVDSFEDLVDSVDFPAFVRDLLKSVFDANISVMKAQTDDYIRLMKEATTGLGNFIKQVGDDNARAYVAENNPAEFNILVEEDGQGGEKIALTRPDGERVEGDEEASILADAKIRMAQEHRHALREMILMGITRLVVERGEIEAEVNFEFRGNRQLTKADKALLKKDKLEQGGVGNTMPLFGILGGIGGSYTNTTKTTEFSVSSTKSQSEDDLRAKLRGFVNIKFKTDYFRLDNFAQMYGPPSPEEQQAAISPGMAPRGGSSRPGATAPALA